eukprot:9149737-Ditylum_brightwellii.AAC.1
MKGFLMYYQKPGVPSDRYLEGFTSMNDMIEHTRVRIADHSPLITSIMKKKYVNTASAMPTELDEAMPEARDSFRAMIFLAGTSRPKCSKLLDELSNDFIQGSNRYPKNVVEPCDLT